MRNQGIYFYKVIRNKVMQHARRKGEASGHTKGNKTREVEAERKRQMNQIERHHLYS
jgi:hypothetical protein